jgi:hypothetical protein
LRCECTSQDTSLKADILTWAFPDWADLIIHAAEIGVAMLIVLGLVKLLATGWKGGYIFPIMFAGVARACEG